MNIICFGDSNTWGYDPRSYFGSRYPAESRWPEVLGKKTGWNVLNWGCNGQEIPRETICFPDQTDILIIMLGTNDLLQGADAQETADKMKAFLETIKLPRECVVLICPPALLYGEWVTENRVLLESEKLKASYCKISEQQGIFYDAATDWNIPLCYDGVHFTPEGHIRFADKIERLIIKSM